MWGGDKGGEGVGGGDKGGEDGGVFSNLKIYSIIIITICSY